jgi:hypothetical protein
MEATTGIDYRVLLEAQRLVVDDADFAAEMGDGRAWIAQDTCRAKGLRHASMRSRAR